MKESDIKKIKIDDILCYAYYFEEENRMNYEHYRVVGLNGENLAVVSIDANGNPSSDTMTLEPEMILMLDFTEKAALKTFIAWAKDNISVCKDRIEDLKEAIDQYKKIITRYANMNKIANQKLEEVSHD